MTLGKWLVITQNNGVMDPFVKLHGSLGGGYCLFKPGSREGSIFDPQSPKVLQHALSSRGLSEPDGFMF